MYVCVFVCMCVYVCVFVCNFFKGGACVRSVSSFFRLTLTFFLTSLLNTHSLSKLALYSIISNGKHTVTHAGLHALASLRLEKAYRDYGHDMDNTVSVWVCECVSVCVYVVRRFKFSCEMQAKSVSDFVCGIFKCEYERENGWEWADVIIGQSGWVGADVHMRYGEGGRIYRKGGWRGEWREREREGRRCWFLVFL